MEKPKIYIFRQSALTPPSDGLHAEIAEASENFSQLLSKCEGHYLALEEINDQLADLVERCDFNLQSIQIVSDNEQAINKSRAIGLTKLPQQQKDTIIFSMMAATVAADMLAYLCQCSREEAAEQIQQLAGEKFCDMSDDDINQAIEAIEQSEREKTDDRIVFVKI